MPPVIKIYKVPTENFIGVNDPGDDNFRVVDSVTNPDIRWFANEEMLPARQGRDDANLPAASEAPNEPDHAYKVKLSLSSGKTYHVDPTNDAAGKIWVTTHKYISLIPEIFIQHQHKYLDEVWSYTYVPRFNARRMPYYTMETSNGESRLVLTEEFLSDLADGVVLQNTIGQPVSISNHTEIKFYASFYYWLSPGETGAGIRYMSPHGDYCEMSNVLIEASSDGGETWSDVQGAGVDPANSLGTPFNKDGGYFEWNEIPSGTILRISGYRHTWERLLNTDLADLAFQVGENGLGVKSFGGDALTASLARDLTPQHPWYLFADLKIVNESETDILDKFSLYPTLRGNLDAIGKPLTGFPNLTDSFRPWDVQEGGDLETCGYSGPFTTGAGKEICCVMAWEAGNNTPDYPNFCQPNPDEGSEWIGRHFSYLDKFPSGCPTPLGKDPEVVATNPEKYRGLENVVNYFIGTRTDPGGDVSFTRSTEMERDNDLWKQLNATNNPNRMVIPVATRSSIGPPGSHESMPNPGAIFCRVTWTYRDFSSVSGEFLNTFSPVNETRGGKAFSLRIRGKYYED